MKLTYYIVGVVLLSCWCHNVVVLGDKILDKTETDSSTDVLLRTLTTNKGDLFFFFL